MSNENKNCILCAESAKLKTKVLFECLNCGLLFKNPSSFLTKDAEKKRYGEHKNQINENYLNYLNKLFSKSKNRNGFAVDYGCGHTKGLEALIESMSLNMVVDSYDPLFYPVIDFRKSYDLIYLSECLEHFYFPNKELRNIRSLMNEKSELAVSTMFYKNQDLNSWWYLKDKTHVAFYSEKTFEFIEEALNFKIKYMKDPHVVLIL